MGSECRLEDVATPALLLDLDVLERNLAAMATECRAGGVGLRPHAKTHKSPWVAARQREAGAIGICAAKVSEAEALVHGGVDDVLITTELDPTKFDALLDLAEIARVSVVLDDADRTTELGRRTAARGATLQALVDVDVGQCRAGVESSEAAAGLALHIERTDGLTFAGVQGYEGHLQHVVGAHDRRRRAMDAYDFLADVCASINRSGLEVAGVATAGTGTYRSAIEHGLATEVQPGSYTVMDAHYAGVEGVDFDLALSVLCGVVSRKASGALVVDAGWKAVTTESGPPVVTDGTARYEVAGDEHGTIVGGDPSAARFNLTPSHCDTTINLHESYVLVRGERVVGRLPVCGRGRIA